ncbi:hypothetical protein M2351_007802 [Azospirillum canadense]|nr:hypothetical protein [Azospirillum canadense]
MAPASASKYRFRGLVPAPAFREQTLSFRLINPIASHRVVSEA